MCVNKYRCAVVEVSLSKSSERSDISQICKLPVDAHQNIFLKVHESWKESIRVLSNLRLTCQSFNDSLPNQKDYLLNISSAGGVVDLRFQELNVIMKLLGCSSFNEPPIVEFLKNLQYLDFSESQVDSLQLGKLLKHCSGLEALNLNWCEKLTDVDVSELKKLKKLYMNGCGMLKVLKIKNLPSLQWLFLNDCRKLEYLILSNPEKIEKFEASGCKEEIFSLSRSRARQAFANPRVFQMNGFTVLEDEGY
jgi:hypothetical protein